MAIDFEMPTEGFDSSKVGGQQKMFPGGYMMECVGVSQGNRGEAIINCEVITATCEGVQGAEWNLYLAMECKEWPLRKIYAFSLATGIISQQEFDRHKSAGTNPVINFEKAVGKPFCCELEFGQGEYAAKVGLRFDSIWNPADKRANWIPLNVAKLSKYNPPIVLPPGRDPNGFQIRTEKKPASKPSPAAQAASVDDLLDF